jgi:hypothetical protein
LPVEQHPAILPALRKWFLDKMKIASGSDHAGFEYKEEIKEIIVQLGHDVKDFVTHSNT